MRVQFNLNCKPSSSLIFLSPTIEPLGFWEVLWTVGVTNFIIKFLFMGIKCLILLLPSLLVKHRTQVGAIRNKIWAVQVQQVLLCVFLSPGSVADADWRAGSGPPGHGSCFTVVPLPGHVPGGWRHPWTDTGGPSGIALPHTEGVCSNQAQVRVIIVFKNKTWNIFFFFLVLFLSFSSWDCMDTGCLYWKLWGYS